MREDIRETARLAPPKQFIPIKFLEPRGEIVPPTALDGHGSLFDLIPSRAYLKRHVRIVALFTAISVVAMGAFLPATDLLPENWRGFLRMFGMFGAFFAIGGLVNAVHLWFVAGRRLSIRFEGDGVHICFDSRFRTWEKTVPVAKYKGVQHRSYFRKEPDDPHLHTVELVHSKRHLTLPLYVGVDPPAPSGTPEAIGASLGVPVLVGMDVPDPRGDGSGYVNRGD